MPKRGNRMDTVYVLVGVAYGTNNSVVGIEAMMDGRASLMVWRTRKEKLQRDQQHSGMAKF